MMKGRSNRLMGEQGTISGRNKSDSSAINGLGTQRIQAQLGGQQLGGQSTAAIRKRRSSINVYDQPSSLNSRLRQLETDMLRLDEDRTKLFDDTHSVLAQYELKLNEIHAILKSRQDNVEKYVEDMRLLLQAKEEFEKQTKLLSERQERMHEKFMHRETTISREIKLLKNKFELLEKSRQFRSVLQKSSSGNLTLSSDNQNELGDILADSADLMRSSEATSDAGSLPAAGQGAGSTAKQEGSRSAPKSVRIKLSRLHTIGRLVPPFLGCLKRTKRVRRKSNRVGSGSVAPFEPGTTSFEASDNGLAEQQQEAPAAAAADAAQQKRLANKTQMVRLLGRFFR